MSVISRKVEKLNCSLHCLKLFSLPYLLFSRITLVKPRGRSINQTNNLPILTTCFIKKNYKWLCLYLMLSRWKMKVQYKCFNLNFTIIVCLLSAQTLLKVKTREKKNFTLCCSVEHKSLQIGCFCTERYGGSVSRAAANYQQEG